MTGKGKPATWEEARAGFEPAELIRGQRSLTVEYRHHDGRWTATSPDLDGFEVSASTLPQLKTAAQAVLDDWLDPAVQVSAVEIDDAQPDANKKPEGRNKASGRWAPWRKATAGRNKNKRRENTGRRVLSPAHEHKPVPKGGSVPQIIKRLWGDLDHAPEDIQVICQATSLNRDQKAWIIERYLAALERGIEPEQKRRRA